MRDPRRYSAACLLAVFLVGGVALPVLHSFEHAAHEAARHDAFDAFTGHVHTDHVALSVALPDALLHDFQCVLCAKTLPSVVEARAVAVVAPDGARLSHLAASHRAAPSILLFPIRGPPPVA